MPPIVNLNASADPLIVEVNKAIASLEAYLGMQIRLKSAVAEFNEAGQAQQVTFTAISEAGLEYTQTLQSVNGQIQQTTNRTREQTQALERQAQALGRLQAQAIKENQERDRAAKSLQQEASARQNAARFAKNTVAALRQRLQVSNNLAVATSKERQAVEQQIRAARNLIIQHQLFGTNAAQAFRTALTGAKIYGGYFGQLQGIVQRFDAQLQKLGTTYQQQVATAESAQHRQVEAIEGANTALQRQQTHTATLNKGTKEANKNVIALRLTWESIGRIIAVQILHKAVTMLIQVLRDAIATSIEFTQRVAEIQTISQQAQLDTEVWAQGLARLSEEFGTPILDQAEAAYQTLSNQIAHGAEVFDFLRQSNKLALATVSSSTEAVNLLTASLNAYGADAIQAEQHAAVWFKTIELGRIRVTELANIIGRVAVPAAKLGISQKELAAALSVTTRNGIRVTEAMTQLRGLFLKLIKPTKEMKEFFKELGVNSGEAAIQTFGLSGFLQRLQDRTQGSTTELGKMVSRIRGLIATLALTGNGLNKYDKDITEIRKSTESFNKAAKLVLESTGRRFQKEMEKVRNYFINQFGRTFLKIFLEITNRLGGLDVIVKTLTRTITTFLIPAVLLLTAKLLILAAKNPFGRVIIVAELLIYYFTLLAERANKVAKDIEASFQESLRSIKNEIAVTTAKINDAIDSQAKIARQATAKIIASYNELIQLQLDFVDTLNKKVVVDFKQGMKDITSETKTLEDAFEATQKAGIAARDFMKSLETEVEDEIFKRKLAGLETVDEQLYALDKRATDLFDQIQNLTQKALDPERSAAQIRADQKVQQSLIKEFIKTYNEKFKLAVKALEEEEKLEKKIAETREKEKEQLAKGNIEKSQELFDERKRLEDELVKFQSKKTEEIVTNYEEGYRKILEAFQKETEKVRDNLLQAELKQEQKLLDRKLKLIDLEYSYREFKEFKLAQLLEAKRPETIARGIEQRIKNVTDLIALQEELGAQLDKSRIAEQLITEQDAAQSRIEQIRGQAESKRLEEEITATKESISNLQQQTVEYKSQLILIEKLISSIKTQRDTLSTQQLESLGFIRESAKTFTEATQIFKDDPSVENANRLREALIDLQNQYIEYVKITRGERFTPLGKPTDLAILDDLLRQLNLELQKAAKANPFENVGKNEATIKELQKELEKMSKDSGLIKDSESVAVEELKKEVDLREDARLAFAELREDMKLYIQLQESSNNKVRESIRLQRELNKQLGVRIKEKTEPAPIEEARGGLIPGSGNRDSVPALLTPGEFVVNKRATRQFFSQLVAMNRGIRPMQEGGPVTTIGDINVTLTPSGNESVDVVRIGKLLRREIRRGTVRLS